MISPTMVPRIRETVTAGRAGGLTHKCCAQTQGYDAKDGRQRFFEAFRKNIGKNNADDAADEKSATVHNGPDHMRSPRSGIEIVLKGGQERGAVGRVNRCGDAKFIAPKNHRARRRRQRARSIINRMFRCAVWVTQGIWVDNNPGRGEKSGTEGAKMIVRTWHGCVPEALGDAFAAHLRKTGEDHAVLACRAIWWRCGV